TDRPERPKPCQPPEGRIMDVPQSAIAFDPSTPVEEVHTVAAQSRKKPIREIFYRHKALVRLTHWINALCILFLLGSGLNIFNAHPHLYWSRYGADANPPDHAFFSIGAFDTPAG